MNVKKFIMALVAGFIVMMGVAYVFHVVLMKDSYDMWLKEVSRPEGRFQFILYSYLCLAALMAYIYPMGYKGGSPFGEGLKFGILMGLVCRLPLALVMSATTNVVWQWVAVEAAWHCLEQGIGGIVIAYMYGSPKAAS